MNYTILGGGIAGLTAAVALRKIGIEAPVFEAAPDLRPIGAGLLLAANAVKAYQHLGIAEQIIARGRLLPTFRIMDHRGRTITAVDAATIGKKYGLHNFAIHRARLQEALLRELAADQVILGKRATGFSETEQNGVQVQFADGSTHTTNCLIVAEGIHSSIRQQLLPDSQTRYAGYTCWRAVIDTPPSLAGLSTASETWGPGKRFGIVPLADDKIYWFACLNAPENDPAMRVLRVQELQHYFGDFHDPVPTILEHTGDSSLIWNDIIDLKPVDKYAFGRIVLIGDAAHATTPNLGQGACQAIEDAVILAREIEKADSPETAFQNFEKLRLQRTHYIVNNSWRMGKLAQWENPLLIGLRNGLLRLAPASVNERQMKTLLDVAF